MSFADRVKALRLPLDQIIVVGSGLLEQRGMRHSSDVDLLASSTLFSTLDSRADYVAGKGVYSEDRCYRNDVSEVYLTWFGDSFETLRSSVVEYEGVLFANPATVRRWKQTLGREKDKNDIVLLEEMENE